MTLKEKLYKPLKILNEDTNILFWGCTHINHNPRWDNPIWKQRGYNSADNHKDGVIKNWNQKANEETDGVLLGDVMFGGGGADEFFNILNRLRFKNLYIQAGNHFAGFHQALELTDENGDYNFNENKKVIFLSNYFEAFVNGQPIAFSHYPILSYNGQAKGAFHLFSHVHGNLGKSKIGKAYLDSGVKAYEVSVEKNPSPINFSELKKIMRDRENVSFDHHSAETQNPF